MTKKTLIIDCDGVLYPASMLTLREFVDAMKDTYRNDLKVDGATQEKVSKETLAKNRLGMFNYINAMCNETGHNFDDFCHKMQDKIDYSKISPDVSLYNMLVNEAKKNHVVILTNNHMSHLDKVLQQRFGKTVFEMQEAGIECFDIKSTMRNGVFYPKQDPKALSIFTDRLGVNPQDCVLIDDTKRNLDAAKQIGMQTFLIDEDKNTLKHYLNQNRGNNIMMRSSKEND